MHKEKRKTLCGVNCSGKNIIKREKIYHNNFRTKLVKIYHFKVTLGKQIHEIILWSEPSSIYSWQAFTMVKRRVLNREDDINIDDNLFCSISESNNEIRK